MNFGTQSGLGGGLQLGGGGAGLKLGMPTAAVAPQPAASTGQTQLSGAQWGLKQGLGQAGGLQLGAGQAGGLQLGAGQAGGLQLGAGQAGGLQLGAGQAGGLQLGASLPSSTGGLQLGMTQAGLQLGGGGVSIAGAGPQLGALSSQSKGLQLGGTATTQLGGGGLQLGGVATPSKGLQLGGLGGGGFGLGGGTGLGGGLQLGGLGAKPVSTAATTGLTGVKPGLPGPVASGVGAAVTTTAFKGLGGVDPNAGRPGGGDQSVMSVLEQPLPPVLNQLVHELTQHTKEQTTSADEIDKFSESGMKKVQRETETQRQAVREVSAQVQRDAQRVAYLRHENTQELSHAEISQRTHELPAALQHDNTAPAQYFQSVVDVYESKMELYRNQLLELESHLSVVGRDTSMSPSSIIEVLQVQYRPFLLLAAQLQTIHEQVQVLKEQYLTYRRIFLQDSSDVFEERRKQKQAEGGRGKVKTGPPPFSAAMGQATTALAAFSVGGTGNRPTALGVAPTAPASGQAFQLQRPPLGKKRGTGTT